MSANAPPAFEPIEDVETPDAPPPGFVPLKAVSGPPAGFVPLKGMGPPEKSLYLGLKPGEAPADPGILGTAVSPATYGIEPPSPAPYGPQLQPEQPEPARTMLPGGMTGGPQPAMPESLTQPVRQGEPLFRGLPMGAVPQTTGPAWNRPALPLQEMTGLNTPEGRAALGGGMAPLAGIPGAPSPEIATAIVQTFAGGLEGMSGPEGAGVMAAATLGGPIGQAAAGTYVAARAAINAATKTIPAIVEHVMTKDREKLVHEDIPAAILDTVAGFGGAAGVKGNLRRALVQEYAARAAEAARMREGSIPASVVRPGEEAMPPGPPPEAPTPPEAPLERGNVLPPGFQPIEGRMLPPSSPEAAGETAGGPISPPTPPAAPPAPGSAPVIPDAVRAQMEGLEVGIKEAIQAGNNEGAMAKQAELDRLQVQHWVPAEGANVEAAGLAPRAGAPTPLGTAGTESAVSPGPEVAGAPQPETSIPFPDRRVGPQWSDTGEDVRYQNERRVPGSHWIETRPDVPVEPDLKIEPRPPVLPEFTPFLGKVSRAKTERGTAVETKFALTSVENLVASHDTALSPNPAYPAEFQPRDRERAASEFQIDRILKNLEPEWLGESPKASEGAPIVGPDGVVESGNARAIALRRGYEAKAPNVADYRRWLIDNAETFGLERTQVEKVKHPVLVRVRQGETDRAEFTRQANEQGTAAMSPTEQVGSDAARLTPNLMELFQPSDEGDLMAASNRSFLGAFIKGVIGPTELGNYLDENGMANKQLLDRVRNAVLFKTYGNADVVSILSESLDSNIKNIGNGLVLAAPPLAAMKAGIAAGALHPLDITPNVAEAAQILSSLKREGRSVNSLLEQDVLFGEAVDPATAEVLRYFDQHKRSSKRIALFLKAYAEMVDAAGDPREGELFGMGRAPNIGEVILAAQKSAAQASGVDTETGDLLAGEPGHGAGAPKPGGGPPGGGLQADYPLAASGYRGGRSSGRFAQAAASLAAGGPPFAERGRPARRTGVRVEQPLRNEFLQSLLDAGRDVQTAIVPATVDDRSLASGDVIRYRGADLSARQQATERTLRVVRGRLDRLSFPTGAEIIKIAKMPPEQRVAALEKFDGIRFLDSVETYKPPTPEIEEEGRPFDTPELASIGKMLRGVLDLARSEVQALGTGKLSRYIENYFPHLWSNVIRAQEFAATFVKQRAIEGNKGWMRQRKYPTMLEGLAAGLIPQHRNPFDAVLAHTLQLRKYVMAHRVLDDFKAIGTLRPFDVDTKIPLGWEAIDPRIGQIWGDREIPVEETVDGLMWQKLQDFAKKQGFKVGREVGIGGPTGLASMETGSVLTKFASPMATLVHEIGHALDGKYKIWEQLFPPKTEGQKIAEAIVKHWDRTAPRTKAEREGRARARKELAALAKEREALRDELRQLADLRFEGDEESAKVKVADRQGFTAYVRERPEQIANLFDAFVNHRERLKDVAPVAFKRLEEILRKHGLEDFIDIHPSLVRATRMDTVPLEGKHLLGYLAAPKPVARLLNRYLSPGLQNKPIYRGVRFFFNALNQAQLGLSAYHAIFTALDAMVSRGALGLYQIANGTQKADGLLKILTGPAAPLVAWVRGQKMLEATGLAKQIFGSSLTGDLAADVRATIEAGGRFRQDANYVAAAKARWISALRAALGELEHGRPGAAAKQAYSAAWRTPFAAIEAAAGPIMEWWVPRLKLGTFAEMARAEVERLGEDATRSEIRRALARAWDSVDNRMGQLAYDNLFWNRTVKDLLLISVRSLGWNLGTFREMGGGVIDTLTIPKRLGAGGGGKLPPQPPAGAGPPEEGEEPDLRKVDLRAPWFTHKMGYLLYGAFLMGLVGATIHYLRTGKSPKDAKDIYFPETGGKNRDGTPERLALPSYVKEPVAWYKHPWETLLAKLNPGLHVIENLARNREFPNTRIFEKDDTALQNGLRLLGFLGRQNIPIGMRGLTDRPNPASALPPWGRATGLIAAPGYITKSPAAQAIADWYAKNPTAAVSREQAEKKQGWRELVDKYRQAQTPADRNQIVSEDHSLTPGQRGQLRRQGGMTALQRSFLGVTDLVEQLRIYDLASPEDKQELRGALMNKLKPHVNVDTRGRVHVVRPGWGQNMTADEKARLKGELETRLNQEAPP